MSPAKFREDIMDLLEMKFADYPEVYKGKMFGHPGFRIGDRFFTFAFADGIALKVSPAVYKQMLKLDEAEAFSPHGTPMGTWVTLTYPEAESYIENWNWIEKAMDFIGTDEAKPPQKKRKKQGRVK